MWVRKWRMNTEGLGQPIHVCLTHKCRTQLSPLSSGWIQAYFKSHIDSSSRGPRTGINSKGEEKLGERGKAVIMNQSLCYFSHTPNKHSKIFKTGIHNGPVLPLTGLEVDDVSLSLTESRTPNGPNWWIPEFSEGRRLGEGDLGNFLQTPGIFFFLNKNSHRKLKKFRVCFLP